MKNQTMRRVSGLFVLADQLELRLAQARGQVAKLTPSLLAAPSPASWFRKIPPTNRQKTFRTNK